LAKTVTFSIEVDHAKLALIKQVFTKTKGTKVKQLSSNFEGMPKKLFVPYGAKHSLSILGEARTGARALPSMLSEWLAPYGISLAELTIIVDCHF
jgi:hypothetical protein